MPARGCESFSGGTECENRWASVVDGPHRSHFLGQPDVKADSARSLLARGVKRRLLGVSLPGIDSNGVNSCSETLKRDPAACKASKGHQIADDLDSFSRSHTGQRVGTFVHAEQQCQTVRWPDRNIIPASILRPSHWQCMEESDADVAVDVDCCGDSGSASKLSARASAMSAYVGSKAWNRLSSRNACQPLPTLPEQDKLLAGPMGRSLTPAKQQQVLNTQVWYVLIDCCLLDTTVHLGDFRFAKHVDASAGSKQQLANGYDTQNAES